MIDPKRLHKAATDALTGNGVNTEMAYTMQVMQLLTCPDPLTLDAAVQVMGREPDRLTRDEFGERGYWIEGDHWIEVSVSRHLVRAHFPRVSYDNPTIGQFACLVLAAKQAETT